MLLESWKLAEIPGPKKALVFAKPEVVITLIQRAERPILFVEHNIINTEVGEEIINLIISIAKATKIPIVATPNMRSEIIKRGLHLAAWMSITDFTNRLQDPNWRGLHGEGRYDLVLLIGVPYSSGWLILSSLKHFSSDLTTVNLERFYQPNATCSFPNLTVKKWIESLKIILNAL